MTKVGPQNIPVDTNFGTDLPVSQVDPQFLAKEKSMARFSKTKEYLELREYMEGRIEFFQKYLPDGRPLTTENVTDKDWIVANIVVGEFKQMLSAYDSAAEVVKNASTQA